jgi:hypothetical protein
MHSKGRVDAGALVGLPGLEAAERQLEDVIAVLRAEQLLPPSPFEHPAAELSVDDSAQLCQDHRQPDHIA